MKKLISILLSVLMLACLCGCESGVDITELINSSNPTSTEDSSITTSAEEQPAEFSAGKIENNVYKNDFLGLSFTASADWTFYTEDQINALNKQTIDSMNSDAASLVQNAQIIYDMYAQNSNNGGNANINLEKFSDLQISTMDVKKTIESQFDMLKSTYQNIGFENINIYYDKITVDGKALDGARLTAKISDGSVNFYGVIFCFKKGNYLVNVSLSSILTDKTDDILNCFKFS